MTQSGLFRADHSGLIYQPLIGLHWNTEQIDFSSKYPVIIVKYKISPETVDLEEAPEELVPKPCALLEKKLKNKEHPIQS